MVAHAAHTICRITADYESLLSLSRSVKNICDFIIDLPKRIAQIVNPIFSQLFTTFYMRNDAFKGLLPFAHAVKYGRDFLTFFELPLIIKKLAEDWVKPEVNWAKRLSYAFQIPQKLLESILLIPSSFNIINLAGVCKSLGSCGSSILGNSKVWSYFTPSGVLNVKDGLALAASIFNWAHYWIAHNHSQGELTRKTQRAATDLNPLQQIINAVVAQQAPLAALVPQINQFNAQAPNRQRQHRTLAQLALDLNNPQIAGDSRAFEKASLRFIRRFILENYNMVQPLVFPPMVPPPIQQRIQRIYVAFNTPQLRLQRVINYKCAKSQGNIALLRIGLRKDNIGWWYELSKMTIITLGLLNSFFNFAPVDRSVVVFAGTAVRDVVKVTITYCSWGSTFMIGFLGLFKTGYSAFYHKPEEERLKAAMPNPRLVFAL